MAAILPSLGPHAGVARLRPRLDPEVGQRRDQHLLDATHMADHVESVGKARDRNDRVPDELAGSVVGDVAAAVDVVHSAPKSPRRSSASQQVGAVTVATHGVDVGVLDQQQVVVGRVRPVVRPSQKARCRSHASSYGEPSQPASPEPLARRAVGAHDSSCSQSQVSRFCLIRCRNSTAVDPSNTRWSHVRPR